MRSARAYLGIGSNLGNRLAYLQLAVDELARLSGVHVVAVSRVYETAPVGGPPQDPYLNAVVAIDTDREPMAVLQACRLIEERAERVRDRALGSAHARRRRVAARRRAASTCRN